MDKILDSEDKDDSYTTSAETVAVNIVHLEPITDNESNQPKATATFAKGKERDWRPPLKDESDDEQPHLAICDYFRKVKWVNFIDNL